MSNENTTLDNPCVSKHLEQQKALIRSIDDGIIVIESLIEDARLRVSLGDVMSTGDSDLLQIATIMIKNLKNDRECLAEVGRPTGRFVSEQQHQREISKNIQKVLAWSFHQDLINKGQTTERYSWTLDNKPYLEGCDTREKKLTAIENFVRRRVTKKKHKFFFMTRHALARISSGIPYIGDYRLVLSMESNIAIAKAEQDSIIDSLYALDHTTGIEFIKVCVQEMVKLTEPTLIAYASIAARVYTTRYQAAMTIKEEIAKTLLSDRVAFEAEVLRWHSQYKRAMLE